MKYFIVHEILYDIAVLLKCFSVDCKIIHGDGCKAYVVFSISSEYDQIESSVKVPNSYIVVQS